MRSLSAAVAPLIASSALAMQQTAPPMPKVDQPTGWPLIGYILAAVLLVAGIFVSVRSSNRQEIDESGNLKS
jgi:hypothetical protein